MEEWQLKQTVLLGGYTRKGGQGIYSAHFDDETGTLTTPQPYFTALGSPTYLAISQRQVMYAIDGDGDQGGIAAIDMSGAHPRLINTALKPGSSPAHVSLDEQRQLVFASNYHAGRLNVYKIGADGAITETDEVQHDGRGPRPEQESSHVHFASLTPDKRLVAIDLGNDRIYTYDVTDDGKLNHEQWLQLPAGYGPRHIQFHHQRSIAYVLGELSSQISVLRYRDDGTFQLLNTQSTIPADWTAHNGAAAIRLSADNRFLYVSNRGYNSIAVYAVSDDGLTLTLIQQISSEGDFPRDFNLDLTEKYVLLVNQNTSNGTLYQRNAQTGILTLSQKEIVTPEAVNVNFLAQ